MESDLDLPMSHRKDARLIWVNVTKFLQSCSYVEKGSNYINKDLIRLTLSFLFKLLCFLWIPKQSRSMI